MLAFAGKQMLNLQTMNLNEAILDIHPMLEQSAGETTAVVLKLDPALRQCKMDVVQFDTTLLNLAVNAKDAMAGGGTLTITTRNTHLDQADDTPAIGPCVAVSVEDTGSGMTDAVRERVFEPFFTTKQMGTGTGLGLSQVHGFVRQIGGHVTVDSKPGGGTTVTMYFPSA
jgi:signal transduction histidine kinase